jgi:stage II sporulation protein AA (anti-sigma F factor antagonist)
VTGDQLSLVSGVRDGCRIVVVSGDLDADTASQLDDLLDTLPVVGVRVLLDLAGLRTLTSAGVHVLLKSRAFGHPAIYCPSGPVSRVLDIVQAHRLVPIYAGLQAALDSLTA